MNVELSLKNQALCNLQMSPISLFGGGGIQIYDGVEIQAAWNK